ncbi:MAG TPA: hypothetical protein VGP35_11945 [Terriglobales bacterium]|nr:hypothetical protein [Terriglobales bacterium]
MSTKTASWIIGAGVLMMFIGLCFLPGAFGAHPGQDMLEIAACQFSLGALIAAGGIYAKARVLQFAIASGEPRKEPATANQRVRGGCDLCGTEAPVVQCRFTSFISAELVSLSITTFAPALMYLQAAPQAAREAGS